MRPDRVPTDPNERDVVAEGKRLEQTLSHQRYVSAEIVRAYYGQSGMSARSVGSTYATGTPPASTYLRALESLTANNLLSAVVDTAVAQLVQQPDIRISTTGVGWTKQVNARRIGRAITGVFHASGLHEMAWHVAVDAACNPLGAVRFWMDDDGRLRAERVLPHHVVYNPAEGRKPRNLYLHYGAPREALCARFPKHEQYLSEEAPRYLSDGLFDTLDSPYPVDADLIDVWEHWSLGEGGDPGKYRMVVGERKMTGDAWDHDFFPVVELRWAESYNSFGGRSLGAQLLPYQTRVNRMMRVIDEAQTKACVPRLIAPKGSEFTGMTNRPMETIWYNPAAGKPELVPGVALPPEFYASLESEIRRAFELAGVSTTQGTGSTRAGLNSGRAIREDSQVAATRLRGQGTRIDNWFERCARVALALMCSAYRSGSTRKKAPGTHLLDEIDWESFDVREDELDIRCTVVSGLPGQPAARLEYVQELIKSGLLKQRHALRMLAIPDVDKYEDSETAAFDLAAHQIEAALYDQKYIPPEAQPPEYLEHVIELGYKELLNAVRLEAPPASLELLRRLIAAAERIHEASAPAPQAGTPQMGMPPGMGEPANPYAPPEAMANPAQA